MSGATPQRSSRLNLQQPADLQLYLFSAEKRQRVSKTQSPTTPAKGESRVAALAVAGRTEPLEDTSEASLQSPVLELSDGEADEETSAELSQEVRIKVLRQELKHVQHELATAKQVTAEMQAEKERTDKEAQQLRTQLRQLASASIENCSEEELYEISRMLDRAQGRIAVERTRQAASKHLTRRLDL